MTELLMFGVVAAHGLVVAVLVALLVAAIVGVVFHFLAPQYAGLAALLTFLVFLLLAVL